MASDDDGNNVIQGPWLGTGKADTKRGPFKEIEYDFQKYEYFLVMGWKHPVINDPQVLAIPIRPKKTVEQIMRRYRDGGGVWLNPFHPKEAADGINVEGVWYPWPPVVIEIQKRRKKS